jgi:hypothetical protein
MAIQPVICQKSDFHGIVDFKNSQKLEPLQIPAKEISRQKCQPLKNILVQEIDTLFITKVR